MGNQLFHVCKQDHLADQKFSVQYQLIGKILQQSTQTLFDCQQIQFPLSTYGWRIVDSKGRRVKLAGANWSGAHAQRHCVSGLQHRTLDDMAKQITKKFDMNCIRLTFSLQMFYDNNIIDSKLIAADPSLSGKTSMDIFDATVQTLTRNGLMVILNNHTSSSQWCCSDSDGDGLWYSKKYPQQKFFNCLIELAKRYKNNPRVIGMDLRNEIRRANGKTPTWGDNNPETDWRMAAEKIGNQLLKVAPHWLIFVSGLQYQLDLTRVKNFPVNLNVKNKLVYTGHFYGFSWPLYPWDRISYESFYKKFFNQQLYVRGLGVPYYMGEFGNNCQDISWTYLMRLLKEEDIDWTYWCLDGYKCKNQEDETFGIWSKDYKDARHPLMLRDIKRVGRPINRNHV